MDSYEERRVFVTPNVVLIFSKCTVPSTFPRIRWIKLISRSWCWPLCLDMRVLSNVEVHRHGFSAGLVRCPA